MWSRRTAAVRDAELAEACEEGHLVIPASQPAGRLRFLVSAIPCARPESVLANDRSLSLRYKAFFFRAHLGVPARAEARHFHQVPVRRTGTGRVRRQGHNDGTCVKGERHTEGEGEAGTRICVVCARVERGGRRKPS